MSRQTTVDDPKDCDHDNMEYKGTDTDGAPEAIYEEWVCLDCGAFISNVYEHAGYRIVQPQDGGAYEEEVEA